MGDKQSAELWQLRALLIVRRDYRSVPTAHADGADWFCDALYRVVGAIGSPEHNPSPLHLIRPKKVPLPNVPPVAASYDQRLRGRSVNAAPQMARVSSSIGPTGVK